MRKALMMLPFVAVALIGAAPAATPPAAAAPILPPAAVAADPANRLMLELSNGGRVVIQLRPDAAPAH